MPERKRDFIKRLQSAAIAVLIITAIITLAYLGTRSSPANKLNKCCGGLSNSN